MIDLIHRNPLLRSVPAVMWMLGIFILSSQSKVPSAPGLGVEITAIAGHAIAYGVLGLLILFALTSWWKLSFRLVLIASALTLIYGMTDEFHQSFVPGRDASLVDLAIDGLGALVATSALYLWAFARSESHWLHDEPTQ